MYSERFYDLEDAAEVTWNNLPRYLKDKYEIDEIFYILGLEYKYLESIGVMVENGESSSVCTYPIDINQEKMEEEILQGAIKNDIFISYEELDDILTAELEYYRLCDALDDARKYLN